MLHRDNREIVSTAATYHDRAAGGGGVSGALRPETSIAHPCANVPHEFWGWDRGKQVIRFGAGGAPCGALGSGGSNGGPGGLGVERTVVAKIWVGLTAVAIELLLLGWLVASHGVDCLTAGPTFGR